MKIYKSNTIGNAKNVYYKTAVEVFDENSLKQAVNMDYVCAEYKEGYRNNDNFLGSTCLPFDCDNDGTDDSSKWLSPEDIKRLFPGVTFAVHYSRNHMKDKHYQDANGEITRTVTARPRFHLFFEIDEIKDRSEYANLKDYISSICPYFDKNALDASRFFYGTTSPSVEFHKGSMNLSQFLDDENFDKGVDVVSEGGRNNHMSRYAARTLVRLGDTEEAKSKFLEENDKCSPPLEDEELNTIWNSALNFYKKKVMTSPGYVSPAQYNAPWKKNLIRHPKTGAVVNCIQNLITILENDPMLQGIKYNQLADSIEITAKLPWNNPSKFWRDADDSQLICYIDEKYGSFSKENYINALTKVADDRGYHPIKEYFNSLPEWDEIPRVDTFLIDYFGSEDNEYVRAVTRKTLCAAYLRVLQPGIKFDQILVLVSKQGSGKSTAISKLGMQWYSDSLSVSDMNDKTAAEKLQGYWIMEIGELAGMKKADIDKVKAFISRQDDKFRAAYGRRVTSHPRQCICIGTTNAEDGFLRDVTGNRRFWVVNTPGTGTKKSWNITRDEVDQIWAEVMIYVNAGEELTLDSKAEEFAQNIQCQSMEQDDREGLIEDYLNTSLPDDWDRMDLPSRLEFLDDTEHLMHKPGTHKRVTVSNMEIWCECLGRRKEDLKPVDSFALKAIMMRLQNWSKVEERMTLPIYGRQRIYRRLKEKDKN